MVSHLGIYASQISGHLAPVYTSDYESIATYTVGSGGVANVTFSSIPQTYKHLQVRGIFKTTNATWVIGLFNGDAVNTGNYSEHDLRGNGSTVSAEATSNANTAYFILGIPVAANTFAAGITDILDYTNTGKYKTVRSLSGMDANGSGNIDLTSSSRRSTQAITEIKLAINNGDTIPQYSQFALYGIKG